MSPRPAKPDAKETAKPKAAKKASVKKARAARPEDAPPPRPEVSPERVPLDSASLKEGISSFLTRSQAYVTKKAPDLAEKAERAAHVAIDATAKGLGQFEKNANNLEAKAAEGVRSFFGKLRR